MKKLIYFYIWYDSLIASLPLHALGSSVMCAREDMWDDFTPEEIAGEDRTINKIVLTRDFLDDDHCKVIRLTSPETLSDFLKEEIEHSSPGVYCIYNDERKVVFDIGKSRNLKGRIRKQLVGVRSREDETRPLKFPRLFFAFLKREYDGMKQKEYNRLPNHKKKEYVESYQNKIFRSGNKLRVCITKNHLSAIVLEHTLIKYFKSKGQCRYNFQV